MNLQSRIAVAAVAVGALAGSASSALASPPPPGVSAVDETYLKTSIQGDRFEIIGGRVAAAKGTNAAVRRLGARLVRDHTQSLSESIRLAKSLGIDVPKAPTPPEAWELRVLRTQLQGAQFDHWYAELEALDHQQDLRDVHEELGDGFNARVRANARTDQKMLVQHLRQSESVLHAL